MAMMWSSKFRLAIRFCRREDGAVAMIVALSLTFLVGITAMSVDIGHWFTAKNQLQNAADAAALAGASKMLAYDSDRHITGLSMDLAFAEAKSVSLHNKAMDVSLDIQTTDCTMGWWNFPQRDFDPSRKWPLAATSVSHNDVTAFRVLERRDETLNSPLNTFFAGIVNINQVDVRTLATAYLGFVGNVSEGEVEVPIALRADRVTEGTGDDGTPRCGEELTFRSESDETSEWTTFLEWPTTDVAMRRYVTGETTVPALDLADPDLDEINVINGTLSNLTFEKLYERFLYEADVLRGNNDGDIDPGEEWPTWVPVIEPSGAASTAKLVGFMEISIFEVLGPPDKLVRATIKCDSIIPYARSGGGNFGTRAGIPVLIQ